MHLRGMDSVEETPEGGPDANGDLQERLQFFQVCT